ncbi:Ff.00g011210.m01.CDS01 [Fusarium sp. VM40]|nr:Ff.00g011210.m01.CDS01 [Fusarium sp. VM40]
MMTSLMHHPFFTLLGLLFLLCNTVTLANAQSPAIYYDNPLIHQRADPHILKHTDGWYYFTASVPEYDRIILRRSETIQGLADAREVTIWNRESSKAGIGYVWAPEIHHIDGKWYIYFALGRKSDFDIRMFVLEGAGDDALTALWVEKSWIETDWDTFSLDATTFEVNNIRYLSWAQAEPDLEGTSLMLAPMENPWTLKLPAVVISRPELAWERVGHNVNEGPYALIRNNKVWLTFSASATDHNYVMGLLSADVDAELMNPDVWSKTEEPVFMSNTNTSQYGPGHNCFTTSEDGLSDIMIYHSRQYRNISGEPLNNPDRHARVQKLYWNPDGTPAFGIPVVDGETPIRLRSTSKRHALVEHNGSGIVGLQHHEGSLTRTQFRIISPGLAGRNTISLELADTPGFVVAIDESKLSVSVVANGTDNKTFASFIKHRGLSDGKGASFEMAGKRGHYVQTGNNNTLVVSQVRGKRQKRQATFHLE